MRVMVTGGSGYVGSHAARALVGAGHEVLIYDNLSTGYRRLSDGFPLVEGDIGDVTRVSDHLKDVDAVLHFAASSYVGESVQQPRKYLQNNVEHAIRFLDAVIASKVRTLVFSSTCATYGVPRALPIREDSRTEPVNIYGATKLFFEQMLSAYAISHGLRFVAFRYFNAAGAHPDGGIGEIHTPETHLIPLALKAALDIAPPLQVFGADLGTADGTCIRDFVHVSDLAAAHVLAMEYLLGGGESVILNLGTGKGTSVAEVLAAIERVTGRKVPHAIAPARRGDPPALYADPAKSKAVLGWAAKWQIEEIIGSAWRWEVELQRLGWQREPSTSKGRLQTSARSGR